jgi:hypothetical protein
MISRGVHYSSDENGVNRVWNDLELFVTMESNDIAYNNLRAVRNPDSQREKWSECVVPLPMPESEWNRYGMKTLRPQRW